MSTMTKFLFRKLLWKWRWFYWLKIRRWKETSKDFPKLIVDRKGVIRVGPFKPKWEVCYHCGWKFRRICTFSGNYIEGQTIECQICRHQESIEWHRKNIREENDMMGVSAKILAEHDFEKPECKKCKIHNQRRFFYLQPVLVKIWRFAYWRIMCRRLK